MSVNLLLKKPDLQSFNKNSWDGKTKEQQQAIQKTAQAALDKARAIIKPKVWNFQELQQQVAQAKLQKARIAIKAQVWNFPAACSFKPPSIFP